MDEAGRTIEWNRAMEEITGFPRGVVLGRPIEEVQEEALNPAGSAGEITAHPKAVSFLGAGTGSTANLDADFELLRADGRRIVLRQTTFRIPTARGFRTGSIVHDVTARRHAELEREGFISELEARNAELERFTYTVSHDLRSPLVTVRGFLGYLEEHAVAGDLDRLRSDVDRIVKATGRMDDLLRDLLELSRIGRIVNPPVDCPFGSVVTEAMEMVQGPMAERGVRRSCGGEPPRRAR